MRERGPIKRVTSATLVILWLTALSAQQLIDRIVARVGADAITQTDVRAALGFGIVEPGPAGDPELAALSQLIDRQLELAEVARLTQPEPDDAAVNAELSRLKSHAGDRLNDLMASTGVDEERLRDFSRDTLRIQTYLENRFPAVPVSDAEAEQFYRTHPDQFPLKSFEQASSEARAAAAAERRGTRIAQWLANLRIRVEVVIPPTPPAKPPEAPPGN